MAIGEVPVVDVLDAELLVEGKLVLEDSISRVKQIFEVGSVFESVLDAFVGDVEGGVNIVEERGGVSDLGSFALVGEGGYLLLETVHADCEILFLGFHDDSMIKL